MDETAAPRPSDAAATGGPSAPPTRRRVLALVAATGAGGALLAACGGSSTAGTTAGSGGGSTAPAPGGSSAATGGGGKQLVATSKVPVGGGVVLDGPKVVVTQPTAGTFKAFSAVCTHQGCTVGMVKDGVITCPCHGSAYSAADGSVKNGPSTTPLPAVQVAVQGGNVVEA